MTSRFAQIFGDGLDQSVHDSANVAEGFIPVQQSLNALKQAIEAQTTALKAMASMQSNFGTTGSSPYSEMVDGGSATAGQTTTQTIKTEGLRHAPDGAWSSSNASRGQASPSAPSQGPGGVLAAMGRIGFQLNAQGNPAAGQTFTSGGNGTQAPAGGGGGGWGRGGNLPTLPRGGSFGGSGSSDGAYATTMGTLQKVPGIGQALAFTNEIQSQRQKNAVYQNVEGSDNMHGFGERYNEALGSFTTMGMFAPGEYSDLYQGATKLGYTDRSDGRAQSREGVMNFGYENKSSMGMDASESLKYAGMASKSASTSFSALSAILQKVSEDANKAGVNANFARAQTMNYYQAMLQSDMTGPSATSTAGALGMYQTAMGKTASDNDYKGMYSTGQNFMVAAQNGVTFNQLTAMQNLNPARAEAMRSKTLDTQMAMVITPEEKGWIQKAVNAAGGPAAIQGMGASILDKMSSDFLNAYPDHNVRATMGTLKGLSGTDYPTWTAAFQFIANWAVGIDPHKVALAAAKESEVKSGATKVGDRDFGQTVLGQTSHSTDAYKDWSAKTGKSDPVVEAVLTGMNKDNIDQDKQLVQVMAGGKARVVTMTEAVKLFPDQLANGTAIFRGGALDAKNASNYKTLDQSTARNSAADAESANQSNAGVGQALSDYEHANPVNKSDGSGGAGNVGVNITLSDQAAQVLKAIVTHNDYGTDPNAMGSQSAGGRAISAGSTGQQNRFGPGNS